MTLYVKNQSWINAANSGTNLDNEFNNVYASLVDLNTNKVQSGNTVATLTITTGTVTTLTSTTGTITNLTSTNAVIKRPIFIVEDQKANNTAGGTFTNGAWRTRDLNTTVQNTITSASLSSNQISLPAGTYRISAMAQAYSVDRHKIKIRNVTDSTDLVIGMNAVAVSAGGGGSHSNVQDYEFTIAGIKVFELQHQAQTTGTTTGFGIACNFSVIEVYSRVVIIKTA